jgi:hypothetical protein
MHTEVLRAIAGVDVFPVISLVLFVVTFAAAVVWALRLDRAVVDRLSALPLDGDDSSAGTARLSPATQHPALRTRHFPGVSRGA